ncbi:response regulator transcription factor [Natribacillus halophilus]|uniref:DNA-binding response regulator, OmpR family, contains REC and winged-helix (WHTH) domain n=1 Tax=Natribacillus halophilus TaxID=549003 RepID=A0A1G8QBT1_9BACI|nr:response regulator transcription factor [Natribacillus halophilus]SDJ02254.1 DNA-binding response regulator, OmpR family, contains REC and winged-helix (wHTH) domain [Natribacillus halophilus]
MARILIVEDEKRLGRLLTLELEYEGYSVEVQHDGQSGLEAALDGGWDLVILDVMLPSLSGMEILRRFRREDALTPVMMLTAKNEIPDKVSGLDLGANDYVSKPFENEELLARIRVQLREHKKVEQQKEVEILQFEDLNVNVKSREVQRGDDQIILTPREFDLLHHLLVNQGHVLNREQLIQAVWGYDFIGDTNIVDVYIRYLRKKIDADAEPLIHTMRGVGYVLKRRSR